jgi:hypothetical protein
MKMQQRTPIPKMWQLATLCGLIGSLPTALRAQSVEPPSVPRPAKNAATWPMLTSSGQAVVPPRTSTLQKRPVMRASAVLSERPLKSTAASQQSQALLVPPAGHRARKVPRRDGSS